MQLISCSSGGMLAFFLVAGCAPGPSAQSTGTDPEAYYGSGSAPGGFERGTGAWSFSPEAPQTEPSPENVPSDPGNPSDNLAPEDNAPSIEDPSLIVPEGDWPYRALVVFTI